MLPGATMLGGMPDTSAAPRNVAPGVFLIDTGYVRPELTAAYLVRGKESAAFVESGHGLALPRLLAALPAAGIGREDVSYVVVTHVHLDHAGAAGALVRELPRAKLVVHPRGAKHMIDPSKLIAGATEVYGGPEELARKLGTPVAVPKERVIEAPDGFSIDLGERRLVAWDAPGHAQHHFVVLDEATRGFFTGDTFGLSYRELDNARGAFIVPTTTPVQFDPPALHASIDRMLGAKPERMYLTHFGLLEGGREIQRLGKELHRLVDAHVEVARKAQGAPDRHAALVAGLTEVLLAEIQRHGTSMTRDELVALWADDMQLNAQGLGVWLDRQAKG